MSFYSYKDPEILTHEELDEAIVEYLEDNEPEEWERSVNIARYEHAEIKEAERKSLAEGVLESLLEQLDENYGSPDDESTKPTPAMIAAAETLINVVVPEYEVWSCEVAEEISVDILQWLTKNKYENSRVPNFQVRLATAIARLATEEPDGT